jgi:transcriptional regulator with XRE-family HTH domain
MTQADFGVLLGRSRRWVQDLEGGHRQSDPRLSVLEGVARVLSVRMEDLLSETPTGSEIEHVDAGELTALRDTLARHDVITGTCDDSELGPVSVDTLRRSVEYGWTAFQASHFAALGHAVPALVIDASHAAARHEGDSKLASFGLLSIALQLGEALAVKFGDTTLALTAADRAVAASERSENPIIMAAASRHLADAMTTNGQARAASAFAVAAATRLGTDLIERGAAGLSVLGMLYLKAAIASAADQDANDVPGMLDEADHHARRLGADGNALWTAFGPTNVALYRVAAYVQLHESNEALAAASTISSPSYAALPRERRAHHLVDLAKAYTQAGRTDRAVETLLDAEQVAAEEVRCRPRSLDLVEDLRLLGTGSAEGRLQALARRCGLPS